MNAARPVLPMISEPLTWDEICERYPDQWVCLVEIDEIDANNFKFRTARVVGHGKTRRESLLQARPWWAHYDQIAHYSTIPLPAVDSVPCRFVRVDLPTLPGELPGPPRFYPCDDLPGETVAWQKQRRNKP